MKRLILIGLFIITATNIYADTYYTDSIKCPLCNKIFEITKMGSMSTFGKTLDFQKTGAVGDYYKLLIKSCPSCHFSGYTSDFKDISTNADTIELIKNILIQYDTINMTDIAECEVTADLYKSLGESNNDIADLYLYASYILRSDSDRIKKRKQMQDSTAFYFQKAIENGEYAKSEIATIEYLIAEMYRRMGKFKDAIKYYNKAINNNEKAEWVEGIAINQKLLATKEDDDNEI